MDMEAGEGQRVCRMTLTNVIFDRRWLRANTPYHIPGDGFSMSEMASLFAEFGRGLCRLRTHPRVRD